MQIRRACAIGPHLAAPDVPFLVPQIAQMQLPAHAIINDYSKLSRHAHAAVLHCTGSCDHGIRAWLYAALVYARNIIIDDICIFSRINMCA